MNHKSLMLMVAALLPSLAGAVELKLFLNQVALDSEGPKSAVVQYTGTQTRGEFIVYQQAEPVLRGPLVARVDFGAWGGSGHYYSADFSALRMPGRYHLEVDIGDMEALSPDFTIGADALFTASADALVNYLRLSRHVKAADHHIRVFGSDLFVDVWGGWKDAGGDEGKYLTHLSYANFFNPQQTAFVAWSLARSYELAPAAFRRQGLERSVIDEALWGADFLHRRLLVVPLG